MFCTVWHYFCCTYFWCCTKKNIVEKSLLNISNFDDSVKDVYMYTKFPCEWRASGDWSIILSFSVYIHPCSMEKKHLIGLKLMFKFSTCTKAYLALMLTNKIDVKMKIHRIYFVCAVWCFSPNHFDMHHLVFNCIIFSLLYGTLWQFTNCKKVWERSLVMSKEFHKNS